MKKTILICVLAVVVCGLCAFGLGGGCGEPQMADYTAVLKIGTQEETVRSALAVYDGLPGKEQQKFLSAFLCFCGSPEQLKALDGKNGREIIEMGKGFRVDMRPINLVSVTYRIAEWWRHRKRGREIIVNVIGNAYRFGKMEKGAVILDEKAALLEEEALKAGKEGADD